MGGPLYPDLTLAQVIIAGIAKQTGREVRAAEVCAFSDFLQITVAFEEDGTVSVEFSDPLAPPVSNEEVQGL